MCIPNILLRKKIFHPGLWIFFIFTIHAFPLQLHSQNIIGYLELAGRAKKDGKDLSGAKVTLYKNGMFENEVITGKNGKFKFYIDYGYDYKITFNYTNCVEMFVRVFGKIPKEYYHIMPYYDLGEVPFFENNNTNINLDKYKEPFTKIVFDGKSLFIDDDSYLDAFVKDIYVDPLKEAQAEAERIGKEKSEQRAKREALERAKEEQRIKEELLAAEAAETKAREDELARLKEEQEKLAELTEQATQSVSSADVKLLQEKEAKARLEQKNKSIKNDFESNLLEIVASNERLDEMMIKKALPIAESNSTVEKMRLQAELKSKAEFIREQDMYLEKKKLLNLQIKRSGEKKLLEAAAVAERTIKISMQKELPKTNKYKKSPTFNIAVNYEDEWLKDTKTTTITLSNGIYVYKKETYVWGAEYYYKNEEEITVDAYKKEMINYQVN